MCFVWIALRRCSYSCGSGWRRNKSLQNEAEMGGQVMGKASAQAGRVGLHNSPEIPSETRRTRRFSLRGLVIVQHSHALDCVSSGAIEAPPQGVVVFVHDVATRQDSGCQRTNAVGGSVASRWRARGGGNEDDESSRSRKKKPGPKCMCRSLHVVCTSPTLEGGR